MKCINIKDNKIYVVITIFLVVISFIGGTYAYWSWQSVDEQRTNIVVNIPSMCMVSVDGGGSIDSSSISMMPTTCTNTNNAIIKEINSSVSFTDSEVPVKIDLGLKINSISEELTESINFKYAITASSTDCVSNALVSGSFNGKNNNDTIELVSDTYTTDNLGSNNSVNSTYYLYIWLDKEETNINTAGTSFDMSLTANCSADTEFGISDANTPVLDTGMIPVTISNDGTVTTISSNDNNWYNYSNKEWANAILVTESSRSTYLNTSNITVNQSDILGYYVWIPRFRYKIWTTSVSSTGNEQTIDIIFESKDTPKSNGTAVGEYLTHPAFTFGTEELDGFWVGKFETSGSASQPKVLPNVSSLRDQNVSTQFQTSLKFAGGTLSNGNVTFAGSNTYGLTINTDSHMMKNSEWGAVAYLSHSIYGINEEIYINNSSGYYTGRSGGNVGGSTNTVASQYSDSGSTSTDKYYSSGYYTWLGQLVNYDGTIDTITGDTTLGTKASTTGNVTGIYDLSGGGREYVMGFFSDSNGNPRSGNSTSSNSGFNGLLTDNTEYTSGVAFPSSKYYNLYLQSQFTGTLSTNMNFCTLGTCGGHASYETMNWYGDYKNLMTLEYPIVARGGKYDYEIQSGVFSSNGAQGGPASYSTFRSVLVPVKSTKVTYVNNHFNIANQTTSGVTISYDESTSYLTLDGTQTAGIGLMSPNTEFKEGDQYKFTLTYVSGNVTSNANYAIGLDAATSWLGHTSTRNYVETTFPTEGTSSVILTINSAAEEEASKLNHWIWVSSSGAVSYDNYVVKIEVTKVLENEIQYDNKYVLPSTPIREGYMFLGWYTSPTGGTKVTSDTTMNKTNDHSLYARWRVSRVYINYHVNGGTITSSTTSGSNTYTWTTTNSIVYRSVNGGTSSKNFFYKNYGSTGFDLPNWDNASYMKISKSGYKAKDGAEWICSSGCSTANKTFGDSIQYNASDFCDASNGDCTVVLKVNWVAELQIPTFTYTGTYQIVDDNNNEITNPSAYAGNWKIRFLTDGTLTITDLKGASNGVDIFVVGGGGSGGRGTGYVMSSSGGAGGGGGAAITITNFPIAANTSYSLDIGGSSENTIFKNGTTAYYTALAGSGSSGGAGRLSGQTSKYGAESVVAKAGGGTGANGNYEFNGTSGKRYGAGGGSGTGGVSTGLGGYASSGGAGGSDGGGRGGSGCSFYKENGSYGTHGGYDGSSGTNNTGSGGGGGGGSCGSDSTTYGSIGVGGAGGTGIIIIRNHR